MDYKKMKKVDVIEAAQVFESALIRAEDRAIAIGETADSLRAEVTKLKEHAEWSKEAFLEYRYSVDQREKALKEELERGRKTLNDLAASHVGFTFFGWTVILMVVPQELLKRAWAFRRKLAFEKTVAYPKPGWFAAAKAYVNGEMPSTRP